MLPPRRGLSDRVFFSSVCLKSAGRKVTPSWSQQVRRSSSGWSVSIANVQTFVFVYAHRNNHHKAGCKAIDPVPGHLRMFWWRTPRIPGISRVFQSYMVWDLGTPRSQDEQIMMKPLPGRRNKGREIQSLKCFEYTLKSWQQRNRAHNKCLSGWSKPEQCDTIKNSKLISCF